MWVWRPGLSIAATFAVVKPRPYCTCLAGFYNPPRLLPEGHYNHYTLASASCPFLLIGCQFTRATRMEDSLSESRRFPARHSSELGFFAEGGEIVCLVTPSSRRELFQARISGGLTWHKRQCYPFSGSGYGGFPYYCQLRCVLGYLRAVSFGFAHRPTEYQPGASNKQTQRESAHDKCKHSFSIGPRQFSKTSLQSHFEERPSYIRHNPFFPRHRYFHLILLTGLDPRNLPR